MSLVKTPEDEFVHELEGYLDINFDKYSLNKVTGLLNVFKQKVLELTPPTVIYQEKIVYRQLRTKEIDLDVPEIKFITPEEIIEKILTATGLTIKRLTSKDRHREIVLARQVAMYIIRDLCNKTVVGIGQMFNRDHTTVSHSISYVINMIETGNPQYTNLIGYVNFHLSIEEKKTA